jgi:hypothetical protein
MKKIILLSAIIVLIFSNCQREDDPDPVIRKESISGFVQKGPFINGTSIMISELDYLLSQTGKTYNTQIENNQGSFELRNVTLVSDYVSIRADGFYYNEILGKQSAAQVTLYALSDISDKSTVNVNILSHLEKPRIEYLVAQGSGFPEAKIQAQGEVLNIFGFSLPDAQSSELLDITKTGENNAILLATSLILHGFRSEGELTELLANISNDLKENGVLDNRNSGSQLVNHALYLDKTSIRNNLIKRYSDIGVEADIPDFEKYITSFLDNTDFEITESLIEYPEHGLYGQNILDLAKTTYDPEAQYMTQYSLAANLAQGTSLKIKITALKSGIWYYSGGSPKNWSITQFDFSARSQLFRAINSNESCDLMMYFDPGEFLVEYFEMNSDEPTRTKIISVGSANESGSIRFIGVLESGCHDEKSGDLKKEIDYPDDYLETAVNYTVTGDTLDVKVDINYLCSAKFGYETEVINGTLIITIMDTSYTQNNSCYCIYTWNFMFTDFEQKEYPFIIKFAEGYPIGYPVAEGVIDLSK